MEIILLTHVKTLTFATLNNKSNLQVREIAGRHDLLLTIRRMAPNHVLQVRLVFPAHLKIYTVTAFYNTEKVNISKQFKEKC